MFWQMVLGVLGGLVAMWFLVVLLPWYVHLFRIGRRYGWPSQKRMAIEHLLLTGTLTNVTYYGGSYDPNEEFVLIITGPFGQYVRRGTGGTLRVDPSSDKLPAHVAAAFDGYMAEPGDVVTLLWHLPFLHNLQQSQKPRFTIGGSMPASLAIGAT